MKYHRHYPVDNQNRTATICSICRKILSSPAKSAQTNTAVSIREISGLTVAQLSAIFGISRQGFYNWLRGEPLYTANKEHLLEVKVLLEEVMQRLGDTQAVHTWLLTPTTPGGDKPITYLKNRQYDIFRGFLLRGNVSSHNHHSYEEMQDELDRLSPKMSLADYPDIFAEQEQRP